MLASALASSGVPRCAATARASAAASAAATAAGEASPAGADDATPLCRHAAVPAFHQHARRCRRKAVVRRFVRRAGSGRFGRQWRPGAETGFETQRARRAQRRRQSGAVGGVGQRPGQPGQTRQRGRQQQRPAAGVGRRADDGGQQRRRRTVRREQQLPGGVESRQPVGVAGLPAGVKRRPGVEHRPPLGVVDHRQRFAVARGGGSRRRFAGGGHLGEGKSGRRRPVGAGQPQRVAAQGRQIFALRVDQRLRTLRALHAQAAQPVDRRHGQHRRRLPRTRQPTALPPVPAVRFDRRRRCPSPGQVRRQPRQFGKRPALQPQRESPPAQDLAQEESQRQLLLRRLAALAEVAAFSQQPVLGAGWQDGGAKREILPLPMADRCCSEHVAVEHFEQAQCVEQCLTQIVH